MKTRLLLIVCLAMIPFAVLLGFNMLSSYERERLSIEQSALRIAYFISTNMAQMLDASRQFLVAAVAVQRASPPDLGPVLLAVMGQQSAFIERFSVLSAEGETLYPGSGLAATATAFEKRLVARAVRTGDLVVEMLNTGDTADEGRLCVAYSPPSDGAAPRFAGFAILNLAWFNYFMGETTVSERPSFLPREMVLTILTGDGVVLNRSPDSAKWIGRAVPASPIFQAMRSGRAGTVRIAGLDGVDRFYAFRPVQGTSDSLYVNVGVSERAILVPVVHDLARSLFGLLALSLAVFAMLWIGAQRLITHPVTALLDATRRVKSGDLKARVDAERGPAEIREWARSFNEMTTTLDRTETERAQTQARVMESDRRLREMTLRLSLAEEQQRRQIAAGIHDEVGPLLAACFMKLGLAMGNPDREAVSALLTDSRRFLDRAIRRSQSLTYDLSSPVLHTLGLVPALDELCQETEREHGLRVAFRSATAVRDLASDESVILYHAARELLHNVVKHAKATRAEVSCWSNEEETAICVADDGVGFMGVGAGSGFTRAGGFGLFNVRERFTHLGGRLAVESEPGCGTRVTVALPRAPAEERTELTS